MAGMKGRAESVSGNESLNACSLKLSMWVQTHSGQTWQGPWFYLYKLVTAFWCYFFSFFCYICIGFVRIVPRETPDGHWSVYSTTQYSQYCILGIPISRWYDSFIVLFGITLKRTSKTESVTKYGRPLFVSCDWEVNGLRAPLDNACFLTVQSSPRSQARWQPVTVWENHEIAGQGKRGGNLVREEERTGERKRDRETER